MNCQCPAISRLSVLIVVLLANCASWAAQLTASRAILEQAVDLYEREKYAQSLDLLVKSKEMAERENDMHSFVSSTGYIGNIYQNFEDYETGLYYWLQGYEAACNMANGSLQSSFVTNIVAAYCRLQDAGNARKYYELATRAPGFSNRERWHYTLGYAQARLAAVEGHLDEAIALHLKLRDYAADNHLGDDRVLFQESEIGNLLVKKQAWAQAAEQGQKCLAMAQEQHNGELQVNAYKILADAHQGMGNANEASTWRDRYFTLRGQVYNMREFNNAKAKLKQYEEQVHNNELNTLHTQINRQLVVIGFVVLCLLLLAAIAVIVVRSNRRLRTAHRLLIEKNAELSKSDQRQHDMLEQYASLLTGQQAEKQAATTGGPAEQQKTLLLKRIVAVIDDPAYTSRPDFGLVQLADAVQSNTTYVSQLINENFQKNFKTLLNERRIRLAAEYLANSEKYGNLTIQAIYEEVGYRNSTSFVRAFKRVYGMVPSDYQRLVRGRQSAPDAED